MGVGVPVYESGERGCVRMLFVAPWAALLVFLEVARRSVLVHAPKDLFLSR